MIARSDICDNAFEVDKKSLCMDKLLDHEHFFHYVKNVKNLWNYGKMGNTVDENQTADYS